MGQLHTAKINHLNYPDDEGRVYCRMKNTVMKIEMTDCFVSASCPICAGSIQGMGVECFYTDLISEDNTMLALTIPDPNRQQMKIAELINKGLIPADPLA